MVEEWRYVPGYDQLYEASSMGRVKSYQRCKSGKIMTPHLRNDGYYETYLCKNGVHKMWAVHRIVATSFLENPESKPTVNHIDGNTANNAVSNLEWATMSEQGLHSYRVLHRSNPMNRLGKTGDQCVLSKALIQYTMLGEFVRKYACIAEVHRITGYTTVDLVHVCNGDRIHSNGYIWRWIGSTLPLYAGFGGMHLTPILHFTNGQCDMVYGRVVDAEKALGIKRSAIYHALRRGKSDVWKYLTEETAHYAYKLIAEMSEAGTLKGDIG